MEPQVRIQGTINATSLRELGRTVIGPSTAFFVVQCKLDVACSATPDLQSCLHCLEQIFAESSGSVSFQTFCWEIVADVVSPM